MEITRDNYELWLTDWFDGNLDKNQIEKLMEFLDENTDIREEAFSFSSSLLEPSGESYLKKASLKKEASDIDSSQIEFLSVAWLEKDISPGQEADLFESISRNEESKRLFSLIQKIRLVPTHIKYENKKMLLRKTPQDKILRLSLRIISTAAVIGLLILSYYFSGFFNSDKSRNISLHETRDTFLVRMPAAIIGIPELTSARVSENLKDNPQVINKTPEYLSVIITGQSDQQTLSADITERESYAIEEVSVSFIPVLYQNALMADNTLVLSSVNTGTPDLSDDDRSRLGIFLATFLREKVLKEDVVKNDPIRAYEIAEAGIAGLNMLLGWEMALSEKNDSEGNPEAIYFSSRMLKFNTPVRKDDEEK